jgi:hypothetical protein
MKGHLPGCQIVHMQCVWGEGNTHIGPVMVNSFRIYDIFFCKQYTVIYYLFHMYLMQITYLLHPITMQMIYGKYGVLHYPTGIYSAHITYIQQLVQYTSMWQGRVSLSHSPLQPCTSLTQHRLTHPRLASLLYSSLQKGLICTIMHILLAVGLLTVFLQSIKS